MKSNDPPLQLFTQQEKNSVNLTTQPHASSNGALTKIIDTVAHLGADLELKKEIFKITVGESFRKFVGFYAGLLPPKGLVWFKLDENDWPRCPQLIKECLKKIRMQGRFLSIGDQYEEGVFLMTEDSETMSLLTSDASSSVRCVFVMVHPSVGQQKIHFFKKMLAKYEQSMFFVFSPNDCFDFVKERENVFVESLY